MQGGTSPRRLDASLPLASRGGTCRQTASRIGPSTDRKAGTRLEALHPKNHRTGVMHRRRLGGRLQSHWLLHVRHAEMPRLADSSSLR
jgi:hypothetical protein